MWGLVCVCVIGVLGLVLAGLVGVVLLVGALVCFCGGLVFLVCWVYCVCLLFRVWCVRRVLRVLAFVVGCVACAFFGSVLAGCVSGGVFGVCGFRSPARAPLVWVWDEMGGGACAAVFVVGSAPLFFLGRLVVCVCVWVVCSVCEGGSRLLLLVCLSVVSVFRFRERASVVVAGFGKGLVGV